MYNADETQKRQKIASSFTSFAFFFFISFSAFFSTITKRQNLQRLTNMIRSERFVIFTFCEFCVATKKICFVNSQSKFHKCVFYAIKARIVFDCDVEMNQNKFVAVLSTT